MINLKTTLIEKINFLNKNNPLILLEEMNDSEILLVEEILKQYKNIKTFIIEKNNQKRVFLKLQTLYKLNLEDNIEGKIHSLYSKKEYECVLKKLLEIIRNEEKPKPFYYRMLGYTYLHFEKIDKAIECFIIAEGLSRKTKNRYRFDGVIKKLEKKKVAH